MVKIPLSRQISVSFSIHTWSKLLYQQNTCINWSDAWMGPWRVYVVVTWSISLNESIFTFNWTLFFNIYHFFIEGRQQKLSKLPGSIKGILNCIFWNCSNRLLYGERNSKLILKMIVFNWLRRLLRVSDSTFGKG